MQRGGRLSYRVLGATVVLVALACCVAVGVFVTRTSAVSESPATGASHAQNQRSANSVAQSRTALLHGLTFLPASGATAVSPGAPVVVTAAVGSLTDVQLTSSTGAQIAGAFSLTANAWHSTGALSYGTAYRVSTTVSGAGRVQTASTASFQTLTPSATVTASVFPNSGLSVGVGQPVEIRFSQEIASADARASVLRFLSVTQSRPVAGGWHWFSNSELHFRPKKFWPPGEHLTVAWNLTGWNAGSAWGAGTGGSQFDIGHARISYADLATHKMTVTDNGQVVARYPISGGKATDPTMGGVHIVMDRQSVVRMNSATNGVPVSSPDGYDELVYSDVHISDTGEYVHAAPWSVANQGNSNVSHGCINLAPDNAQTYFDFSRVGDVVVVTGSPRPPVFGDHGVMDWDTHWSAFTPVALPVPAPTLVHPTS